MQANKTRKNNNNNYKKFVYVTWQRASGTVVCADLGCRRASGGREIQLSAPVSYDGGARGLSVE